jgi:Ran GTPase-activating protein (RanGAP) involved in mRNA processing and transport
MLAQTITSSFQKVFGDIRRNDPPYVILDFASQHMGDVGAHQLSSALECNRTVQKLDLYDNQIGNNGAISLAGMIRLSSCSGITSLFLSKNRISATGTSALATALLRNKSIKELDLSINPIGNNGVITLSATLQFNNTLETLCLRNVEINDSGVRAITAVLKHNTSLKRVDVCENTQITDAGVREVIDALRYTTSMESFNLTISAILPNE